MSKKRRKSEKWLVLLFFVLALFLFTYDYSRPAPLALPGAPPKLYSTQSGDYLQDTLKAALRGAKNSIVLIIYTLKDSHIIQVLNEKAREGVEVKVIYDAYASKDLNQKMVKEVKLYPRGAESLMHLKLLIVDRQQSWLGSANMTRDALKQHANLILNIDNQQFAHILLKKADQLIGSHYEEPLEPALFQIDQQLIELRFLPDDQTAIAKIQELIRSAKKTIKVAMYTFTRKDLAQALVRAYHRGVKVAVVLDESSSKSANAQIVEFFKKEGLPVILSGQHGLMHNKFMVIDDDILVHGSANWTKAAFKSNDDYLMILHNLTIDQKQVLQRLWDSISEKQ